MGLKFRLWTHWFSPRLFVERLRGASSFEGRGSRMSRMKKGVNLKKKRCSLLDFGKPKSFRPGRCRGRQKRRWGEEVEWGRGEYRGRGGGGGAGGGEEEWGGGSCGREQGGGRGEERSRQKGEPWTFHATSVVVAGRDYSRQEACCNILAEEMLIAVRGVANCRSRQQSSSDNRYVYQKQNYKINRRWRHWFSNNYHYHCAVN